MKANTLRLLAVSAAYFSLNPAVAADSVGRMPSFANAAIPETRIAGQFAALAGSSENATNLVSGLRNGSEVTLSGESAGPAISFTPATRPMGYGNITRSLTLAQEYLATQGITSPTPEQLRIALNGGTLTTTDSGGVMRTVDMPGVLQLRSQRMGWGKIAQQLGVTPGNRQLQASTPATGATSSRQAVVALSGSDRWQGAIVSGEGSLLHGRTPGFGSKAQESPLAQTRSSVQGTTGAQNRAGLSFIDSSRPSIGMGRSGNGSAQARGNGRL